MEQVLKRHEVPAEHTWDLDSIYANDEAWERDYEKVQAMVPALAGHQGKLCESAESLLAGLKDRDEIYLLLGQLSTYAGMRRDQDAANHKYQGLYQRVMSLNARVAAAGAYMTPEILAVPAEQLREFLNQSDKLQSYEHELNDLIRQKAHVRSQEVEELLAHGREVGAAPYNIFGTFISAELKFPRIKDEQGNETELTEGRLSRFRESQDRRVREDAFKTLFSTYEKFKNTLATSLVANVKKDVFFARARNYETARAAALSGNNIPESVYDNLIATVNKNLPSLHRYLKLRKRLLGLEQVHMWDLYNPMVPSLRKRVDYSEAVETILASVAPLGPEYASTARKGLTTERWVDIYENEGKRSGAYSSGAYSTRPFILMNYSDNLESLFTLTHELGHSMHSNFTRKYQPFHYGDYTIFVAEVASTLNESLLTEHLLKETTDKNLRLHLINHSLESFRTTLYRQTLFAEFEHLIHQKAEKNEALTAEQFSAIYYDLNRKYYGTEGVVVDKEIELEWARIPHFYYNFYVFQYATGLSAATALCQKVLSEGKPAVERYLGFLKSGSSDYPINELKGAGVDMSSPEPVQQALDVFARRLDEMEALVG